MSRIEKATLKLVTAEIGYVEAFSEYLRAVKRLAEISPLLVNWKLVDENVKKFDERKDRRKGR